MTLFENESNPFKLNRSNDNLIKLKHQRLPEHKFDIKYLLPQTVVNNQNR